VEELGAGQDGLFPAAPGAPGVRTAGADALLREANAARLGGRPGGTRRVDPLPGAPPW